MAMAYSERDNKLNKYEKIFISIAWILAVLVCVKSIFTDFGGDNAYQVAMSYRHLRGDKMLLEMWEPHQTSIFLNDILMFLYKLVVPSFKGVCVYLQVCGTLAFAGLATFLYKSVREYTGVFVGQLMCVFLIVFKAKQTPLLEFSNLEIGFSILLFCTLIRYFKLLKANRSKVKRILLLLASSVFTAMQILSYPSCILTVIAVIFILAIGKNTAATKFKAICVYLGGLVLIGGIYGGYFLVTIGFGKMIEIAKLIISSDTHSTMARFGAMWYGIIYAVAGVAVGGLLALIIHFCLGALIKPLKKVSFLTTWAACCTATEVVLVVFQRKTGIDWTCSFYIIPLLLMLLGIVAFKKMSEEERKIWLMGSGLSIVSCVATALLSDLGIITMVAYLVLGGAVSFITLKYICMDHKALAYIVILCILFHRGMVLWGYGNINNNVILTYEARNIIKSGAATGIVCDKDTRARSGAELEDFANFTNENDKVFVVGKWLYDPIIFVNHGAEISNYSTIDTPYYGESIDDYFRMNPDKTPTVIAVECSFGRLGISSDSFIMKWMEEKGYKEAGEGSYWRFYRLR